MYRPILVEGSLLSVALLTTYVHRKIDWLCIGFDPDPVKKWKEVQKKKELEESGEVEIDADDEEEDTATDKNLAVKLSDYDYLVGMALIKLSEEEKDKLLKESEDKLTELRDLQSKSWADLWTIDLDNFLVELDKQEAREQADNESNIKNAMKKFSKEEKPKGKKAAAAAFTAEVFPAKNGIKIEAVIDQEMKQKYEKIAAPKKERVKKEPKEAKEVKPKKEGGDIKKFLSPSEKPKKEKKARDEWNSDESGGSDNELEGTFDAFESGEDDGDEDVEEVIPKSKPRAQRQVAKKRISDSSKENGDEEDSVQSVDVKSSRSNTAKSQIVSDDEDEAPAPKKAKTKAEPKAKNPPKKAAYKESSDDDDDFLSSKPVAKKTTAPVFDLTDDEEERSKSSKKSVKEKPINKDDSVYDLPYDSEDDKPKKPLPKKAAAVAKKNDKKVTDFFSKKKSKKEDSEDDDILMDDSPVVARKPSGRARPATKYNIDDDDSDVEPMPKSKKRKAIDSDSD